MKKILMLTALAFLATSAFADYVTFQTHGIDMSQVKNRETIFTGGYYEYQKNMSDIQKSFAEHGALGVTQGLNSTSSALAKGMLSQGLNGAATGLGIGLIIAGVDYWKAEHAVERRFVKIELLTMNDGSKKIFQKTMVSDINKDFSVAEATEILNK